MKKRKMIRRGERQNPFMHPPRVAATAQVLLRKASGDNERVVVLCAGAWGGFSVGSGTDMRTGLRDLEFTFEKVESGKGFKHLCSSIKGCRVKLMVEET